MPGRGATAVEEQPEPVERPTGRATLLVVDDDRDVRDILTHYFTAKGFRVETAESGEGIFDRLNRLKPDLLLLDLMLPGEDGRTILDKLRASRAWSRLPVIIITAANDLPVQSSSRDGTDGWFEKPLDLTMLLRHVQQLLF
jgi:two-component system OmpR family response regulator